MLVGNVGIKGIFFQDKLVTHTHGNSWHGSLPRQPKRINTKSEPPTALGNKTSPSHSTAPRETRHRGCGGEQGALGLPSGAAGGQGREQEQPELMDSGKGRRTQLKVLGSSSKGINSRKGGEEILHYLQACFPTSSTKSKGCWNLILLHVTLIW